MPKFKVTTSYVNYQYAEIEAENLEQAEELARDMDGGSFTPIASDDWKIERVEEMPDALTQEQAEFISTYRAHVADVSPQALLDFFKYPDGDDFCERYATCTYSSIMDARLMWLNALNYADKKASA